MEFIKVILLLFNLSYASYDKPQTLEVEMYRYSFTSGFQVITCIPTNLKYCIAPIYPCTPIPTNYQTGIHAFIVDHVRHIRTIMDYNND